jgi:hypothetical protein
MEQFMFPFKIVSDICQPLKSALYRNPGAPPTAQISSARHENAKKAAQFNQGFQRNLTHCKMLSDFALYRSYGTAKYDEKYRL